MHCVFCTKWMAPSFVPTQTDAQTRVHPAAGPSETRLLYCYPSKDEFFGTTRFLVRQGTAPLVADAGAHGEIRAAPATGKAPAGAAPGNGRPEAGGVVRYPPRADMLFRRLLSPCLEQLRRPCAKRIQN